MKKRLFTQALVIVTSSLVALQVSARPNVPYGGGKSGSGQTSGLGRVLAPCVLGSSKAELDINNVRAMVLNGGDMWWDGSNNPRYEVPKVTDPSAPKKHSMFTGAVWLGGTDQSGQLYVAQQTYRQGSPADAGWWPGPLDANLTADLNKCAKYDFHAKINRDEIDAFVANGYISDAELSDAVKNWPGRGNPFLASTIGQFPLAPNANLAPFKDVDGDNVYNPRNGDYPQILGDQAIWWVMNDVGGIKEPQSPAIGLELQVMGFAFATSDLVNNMTFYKQTLINRGNNTLGQTYLGQWVDPDLGNFNDDYVGCDVARGLGICYNGDNDDEGAAGYGVNPPAIGVDFFSGPSSDANDGIDNDRDGFIDEMVDDGQGNLVTEKIIMSNFMYYNNVNSSPTGNPSTSQHYYNYLRSIWTNNNIVRWGGDGFTPVATGLPTESQQYKFMFPGVSDPFGYGYHTPTTGAPGREYTPITMPTCKWTERSTCETPNKTNDPADRRFLLSAGPFTLQPGGSQPIDLTIGVVWARGTTGPAYDPATGSGLLLVADETAQELFDLNFEVPKGAPSPDVSITELDQELIITLDPEITLAGSTQNVEQDIKKDPGLEPFGADPFYRFEGYVVYQLKDATVSQSDLRDNDKARIVTQSDIANGLGQLVNTVFDPELNEQVPVVQVRGSDLGIQHTFRVTRDLFAKGDDRLVNFKTYYYTVISYSSNAFKGISPATGLEVTPKYKQYREGIENVKRIAAIPHKIAAEGGTVINATANQLLPITRLYGTGNGGNVLEIPDSVEQRIIAKTSVRSMTYESGNSPVAIKVYDPKRVTAADFNLKLSSRLEYQIPQLSDTLTLIPSVGDTVYSMADFTALAANVNAAGNEDELANLPQVPGIGVVRRIVSKGASIDQPNFFRVVLDIEMTNDMEGGTFFYTYEDFLPAVDDNDPVFLQYSRIYSDFRFGGGHVAGTLKAIDFVRSDFWRLNITQGGQTITEYSDRTLTDFNEQLLPEYGLSIQLKGSTDPGYLPQINRPNNFQEASAVFPGGTPWFEGVTTEDSPWLAAEGSAQVVTFDPGSAYTRVLGGSWAPYEAVASVQLGEAGGAYSASSGNRINDLPNIDIVFTKDTSKWTRVPVIQVQRYGNCQVGDPSSTGLPTVRQRMIKSVKPSKDKRGNELNNGSTGMSWFPGYAIDLDRGVRVNMMFAEDRGQGKASYPDDPKGDDLIWDPSSAAKGNRNYIYCMNTVYDGGSQIEQAFDTIIAQYYNTNGNPVTCLPTSNITNFANAIREQIFRNVSWVGNIKLAQGATKLASDARVRLRVNREYISYSGNPFAPSLPGNDNPEYAFTTNGLQVTTNNQEVASSALDLIRVVPNPYYAYSDYEQSQVDNIVKITNLPPVCKITIYTISGTIVQTFNKNDASRTWVDWNLKNRDNLPIASGVYIVHVDADKLGEKVVKWFGVMRPLDLETF